MRGYTLSAGLKMTAVRMVLFDLSDKIQIVCHDPLISHRELVILINFDKNLAGSARI